MTIVNDSDILIFDLIVDTFFSLIKINAGKEKIINNIATDLKISI